MFKMLRCVLGSMRVWYLFHQGANYHQWYFKFQCGPDLVPLKHANQNFACAFVEFFSEEEALFCARAITDTADKRVTNGVLKVLCPHS